MSEVGAEAVEVDRLDIRCLEAEVEVDRLDNCLMEDAEDLADKLDNHYWDVEVDTLDTHRLEDEMADNLDMLDIHRLFD